MKKLTSEQIDQFRQDGYLVFADVFSPDEILNLRAEANRLLEFLVNASLANRRRSGRLDLKALPSGAHVVRKIQPIIDISNVYSALSRDERLLGPIRQLQNEEPLLMEEKFSYKQLLPEPIQGLEAHSADDRFLLHQDYAYHAGHGYQPTIVTCGVVMDDSTLDKGTLQVWPGTHHKQIDHETVMIGSYRSYQVPGHELRLADAVELPMTAGSVIFFHDLLVHSSAANLTKSPRRILFFSFCPGSQNPHPDARNGPTRIAEQPYEQNYERLKAQGRFADPFRAPSQV